jgi:hypothetical protein
MKVGRRRSGFRLTLVNAVNVGNHALEFLHPHEDGVEGLGNLIECCFSLFHSLL